MVTFIKNFGLMVLFIAVVFLISDYFRRTDAKHTRTIISLEQPYLMDFNEKPIDRAKRGESILLKAKFEKKSDKCWTTIAAILVGPVSYHYPLTGGARPGGVFEWKYVIEIPKNIPPGRYMYNSHYNNTCESHITESFSEINVLPPIPIQID
jgi:hypothetical protein